MTNHHVVQAALGVARDFGVSNEDGVGRDPEAATKRRDTSQEPGFDLANSQNDGGGVMNLARTLLQAGAQVARSVIVCIQ